ncbi:hypothetical protein GCM10011502_26830 [Oceanisphaera marina]|uniref:Helix-turn-helix domain-containing protein n=1 Tax=Oceanisphaera marina TaxID=2017550 RepID=A0ABQ1IWQ1_9GAMM|nr:helix-turn-helix domain-containing protein [Oceanisphaera marina]GGB52300.1 hypothetical protein GCM10011502_26830 [Oceanisphaera marina]
MSDKKNTDSSIAIVLREIQELRDLVTRQGRAQKEIISVGECAELLGLSVGYVYRLTHEKRLPHYKPSGKKVYFRRAELLDWLLAHRVSPDSELAEHVNHRIRKAHRGQR